MFTAVAIVSLVIVCNVITGLVIYQYLVKPLQRAYAIQQAKLNEVESKFSVVSESVFTIGKRFVEIERQVQYINSKQVNIQNQSQQDRTYTQASKLIEMGATVSDIMENCKLGQAEARLIARLHGEDIIHIKSSADENAA